VLIPNNFLNGVGEFLKKWDASIFSIITLLAVWSGEVTLFYILYLFWFNELIRIVVDRIFLNRNPNIKNKSEEPIHFLGSFFQMGIYFVFIVVFFGIIANWGNKDITFINVEVFLFQNWFFNANLLIVLFERIYVHLIKQPVVISAGSFTPNMIVLHISIIIGGILMFFLVKNYPETFAPDNLWGSVITILPFILLKMAVEKLSKS